VILLDILSPLGTHIASFVIVHIKKFGHALRIDTSAGSNFSDVAGGAPHWRSLSGYPSDKPPDIHIRSVYCRKG